MVVFEEGALDLTIAARRYRGLLQRMSTKGAKQTTLDTFIKS